MLMPSYWNDSHYLSLYKDVASAVENGFFDNGWMHYRMWGVREGRHDGKLLTEKDYLHKYQILEKYYSQKPSVNCVIACWSGLRRDGFDPYEEDRTYYIRSQLKSLTVLAHSLDQITFVIPNNPKETPEFTKFISKLPRRIGTALVSVERRDNYGQSYGSYSHVYAKYRDRFDFYIFIEDDYIFVEDNFDRELVINFQAMHNTGFLCSLVMEDLQSPEIHAGVANGISHYSVLEKIWGKFGELPHKNWDNAEHNEITKYNTGPQIRFSHAFLEVGHELFDMTHKYQVPFLSVGLRDVKSLKKFAKHRDKILLAPVQYLSDLGLSSFTP